MQFYANLFEFFPAANYLALFELNKKYFGKYGMQPSGLSFYNYYKTL